MELFSKLGIDWRMFVAQLVNFGILLFILQRFVYKPLLGMLEKREQMVAKSVEDARAIEERLKQAESSYAEMINNARKEASQIMQAAEQNAESRRTQVLEKTKEEVRQIVEQTRASIATEKNHMIEEVRSEMSALLVRASQKLLAGVATPKISQEMLAQTVKEVTAQK